MGTALKNGLIRALRAWKFILWILVINLLITYVFSSSYGKLFQDFFEHRLAYQELAERYLLHYLMDFSQYQAKAISVSRVMMVLGVLVQLLFTLFITGGILAYFSEDSPSFSMRDFLARSGYFFNRMSRLFLLQMGLLVVLALFFVLMQFLFTTLMGKPVSLSQRFLALLISMKLTFLLANFLFAWLDYGKIIIVETDNSSVLKAFKKSGRFFFKQFWGSYFIHLIIWVALFAGLGIQLGVIYFLPKTNAGWVLVNFVLLQGFLFFRWWMKWSMLGAQYAYYRSRMG